MLYSAIHNEVLRKRWPITLVFLSSCLALFASTLFLLESKEKFKQSESRLEAQRNKIAHAKEQTEIHKKYHPIFSRLQQSGFIGNDKRLEWLESILSGTDKYKIPLLDYTIEQSVKATEEDLYFDPLMSLEITPMQLRFQFMHEGDWYHLMRHLHIESKGVFSADSCRVQIDERDLAGTELHGLTGSCSLLWYTLLDPTKVAEVFE